MKYFYSFLVIFSLLFMGCQSQKVALKKQQRLAKIESKIESKQWKANFDIASPIYNRGGNAIRMVGSEYVKVKNDSIEIALTYFGTFLSGADITQKSLREFRINGELISYEKKFNKEKNYFDLKIRLKNGREELDLSLIMYSNSKVVLTIHSNHRTPIQYNGSIRSV